MAVQRQSRIIAEKSEQQPAKYPLLLARSEKTSKAESAIIALAVEVIGNKTEAMRWMGTPVRALDYATPVSLLGSREGRQAIATVLGRLEHGVL
jgi:putative toxin-antitoxin system antitoxin component (TIGR02293 family)